MTSGAFLCWGQSDANVIKACQECAVSVSAVSGEAKRDVPSGSAVTLLLTRPHCSRAVSTRFLSENSLRTLKEKGEASEREPAGGAQEGGGTSRGPSQRGNMKGQDGDSCSLPLIWPGPGPAASAGTQGLSFVFLFVFFTFQITSRKKKVCQLFGHCSVLS